MEPASSLGWTLRNEIAIPADINSFLVEGEVAVASFQTFRDSATFTTKRLIIRDAQGLTGKKVEVYSLPYSSINMWSSENARGILDRDAEIELWTRAGHIKVKLGKGADVRRIDGLIAWACSTRTSGFGWHRSGVASMLSFPEHWSCTPVFPGWIVGSTHHHVECAVAAFFGKDHAFEANTADAAVVRALGVRVLPQASSRFDQRMQPQPRRC